MAKVIFEFEMGEDDWLIEIHHKAHRMETALENLARALRVKTKHARDDDELRQWLPLAKLFKECVAGDLYRSPVPTDFDFTDNKKEDTQ